MCVFEYGPDAGNYPYSIPCEPDPSTAASAVDVSAHRNLPQDQQGQASYFRLAVSGLGTTVYSNDVLLHTVIYDPPFDTQSEDPQSHQVSVAKHAWVRAGVTLLPIRCEEGDSESRCQGSLQLFARWHGSKGALHTAQLGKAAYDLYGGQRRVTEIPTPTWVRRSLRRDPERLRFFVQGPEAPKSAVNLYILRGSS